MVDNKKNVLQFYEKRRKISKNKYKKDFIIKNVKKCLQII